MSAQMHEPGVAGATSGYGRDGGPGWSDAHESGRTSSEGMQEQFSWLADKTKSETTEAMQPMKESVRKIAQHQKDGFADTMGGFAKAVDAAAGQCGRESQAMSGMLSAAADTIRSASDSLRDRHIDDIAATVQHFARHRPVALFAGAVAAGFVLSRFLKSSAPEQSDRTTL
jgi:hypothetical protein